MKPLRVALLQLDVRDGEPVTNLARVGDLMAAAEPADLWLLPELWSTGYTHTQWPTHAQTATPGTCDALAHLAAEHRAWIGGSLISTVGRGLANRFWLFPPDGAAPTTYDKVHLFPPMGEPEHLTAGRERVRVSVEGWTAALSICYDLRYPEMYRLDAVDGAGLFLVVAEWPAERAATLRLLAQARAVENQTFLALCNRVGVARDGTAFAGGSLVVAPDGEVLAEAGATEAVVQAVIHPDRLAAVRGGLPVLPGRVVGVDTAVPSAGMESAPATTGRNKR